MAGGQSPGTAGLKFWKTPHKIALENVVKNEIQFETGGKSEQ